MLIADFSHIKDSAEILNKQPVDTISNQQHYSLWKVDTRKPVNPYCRRIEREILSASIMYKIEASNLSTRRVNNVVALPKALSDGYARLNELPINFIWIGSIIPTRYRNNILQWSEQYPERLHVLWVHGEALSSKDRVTMNGLMNKNNIRVLDIAESQFIQETPILRDLAKWLFANIEDIEDNKKLFHYVAASDIYRIALMYFGSEIITQMLTATDSYKKKLVDKGLIYFDTDILFESVQGIDDCLFKGVLEFDDANDIFAASESKMPFFKELLDTVLNHTKKNMEQKSIDFFKTRSEVLGCSYHITERMKAKYFKSRLNYRAFPFKNPVRCADGTWQEGKALNMERPAPVYRNQGSVIPAGAKNVLPPKE
ncbi:hypothetical protein [Endozoicomonas sp.]|uniref:hypothetical protein n=1 Tax=Endozoicomonas sp. TaxID=1892382 RepID=UPI00383B5D90